MYCKKIFYPSNPRKGNMKKLLFPKIEEKEDPAILAARKSLSGAKKEMPAEEKTKSVKHRGKRYKKSTCWRCGKPYSRADLKPKWIRRISQQRLLCQNCIPFKDEEYNGADTIIEFKNIPVDEDEVIVLGEPDNIKDIKFPPGLIEIHEPVKECIKCDSTLFFLLRGGVVRCAGCGVKYQIGSER